MRKTGVAGVSTKKWEKGPIQTFLVKNTGAVVMPQMPKSALMRAPSQTDWPGEGGGR